MIIHALEVTSHVIIIDLDDGHQFINGCELIAFLQECLENHLLFVKDDTKGRLVKVQKLDNFVEFPLFKHYLGIKLNKVLRVTFEVRCLLSSLSLLLKEPNGKVDQERVSTFNL